MITKDENDSRPQKEEGDKKRKHNQLANTASNAKIVSNKDQVNDWKYKDGENWQMWRNKTIKGPTLSMNSKPCLKFHVRGTCFDDCTNKATHKRLEGEDFKQTDDFIRKIRDDFN